MPETALRNSNATFDSIHSQSMYGTMRQSSQGAKVRTRKKREESSPRRRLKLVAKARKNLQTKRKQSPTDIFSQEETLESNHPIFAAGGTLESTVQATTEESQPETNFPDITQTPIHEKSDYAGDVPMTGNATRKKDSMHNSSAFQSRNRNAFMARTSQTTMRKPKSIQRSSRVKLAPLNYNPKVHMNGGDKLALQYLQTIRAQLQA